jgi:hypothetical protein
LTFKDRERREREKRKKRKKKTFLPVSLRGNEFDGWIGGAFNKQTLKRTNNKQQTNKLISGGKRNV